MGRLFWKIFLWFWLTLILIGAGVSWGTAIYIQNSDAFQQRDFRARYISSHVESLRQLIFYGGEEAASSVLQNKRLALRRTEVFVVNKNNKDILGRTFNPADPNIIEHQPVVARDGSSYKIFTMQQTRAERRSTMAMMLRPFQRSPGIYLLWLWIAVLLSGLVVFWLARYLSNPIIKMQIATRSFSQGNLDIRVADQIGNRRDEIADLGKDFDQMAVRIQSLINNQKQLLSDISHELRSPLARMQLAVGLARKKTGNEIDTEMLRIEQEMERLDDLIGQSLTLSRLDAGAAYPKDDFIDIAVLLEDIIRDCDFEAKNKNKQVVFNYQQSWTVNANVELLRRALENIIRNAIHYTATDTKVDVTLESIDSQAMMNAFAITVCDHGKGVPEDKLESLFKPFVRISEARDRDSGGYGLGLAIAKRAIEFHQGKIAARNRTSGGLCIEIDLPANTSN